MISKSWILWLCMGSLCDQAFSSFVVCLLTFWSQKWLHRTVTSWVWWCSWYWVTTLRLKQVQRHQCVQMACGCWTSHLQLPVASRTASSWRLFSFSLKTPSNLLDFCFLIPVCSFPREKCFWAPRVLMELSPIGWEPERNVLFVNSSEQEKNLFILLRQMI